jgi:hypothetical protein
LQLDISLGPSIGCVISLVAVVGVARLLVSHRRLVGRSIGVVVGLVGIRPISRSSHPTCAIHWAYAHTATAAIREASGERVRELWREECIVARNVTYARVRKTKMKKIMTPAARTHRPHWYQLELQSPLSKAESQLTDASQRKVVKRDGELGELTSRWSSWAEERLLRIANRM